MTDAAMPPDVAKLIAELLAYSPARSLGTEAAAKIESLAADNAALAARCEKVRADALEEAAQACDQTGGNAMHKEAARQCAKFIRALASQAEGER